MSTTKKAKVLRDFQDAGTEKSFKADEVVDLTEGEFVNYQAAGLVDAATEIKAEPKKA